MVAVQTMANHQHQRITYPSFDGLCVAAAAAMRLVDGSGWTGCAELVELAALQCIKHANLSKRMAAPPAVLMRDAGTVDASGSKVVNLINTTSADFTLMRQRGVIHFSVIE
jgi:hypothetical protein